MELQVVKGFLLGAIMVAASVAGIRFLRFWQMTADRFFIFIALAFFLEAVSRLIMAVSTVSVDEHPSTYIFRLLSYGLIITAIYDKNRRPP